MTPSERPPDVAEVYEGKAKLVRARESDRVEIYFKDDATAGNGAKRAAFPGKGVLCSRISELLFRYLERRGIATHFLERIDDRTLLCRAVAIIPLEVVVRFRVAGSLAGRTGLPPGSECAPPIVEFYYKRDDLGDPLLNEEHIRLLGLATPDELRRLRELALTTSLALREVLGLAAMDLYDLKLEIGRSASGLLIADEISPDTCRFRDAASGQVLDKDVFRRDLAELVPTYEEVQRRLLRVPALTALSSSAAGESPRSATASAACELIVRPRDGASDPQAEAISEALAAAGFAGFRIDCVGRYLRLFVEGDREEGIRERVGEMCRALLVNPNLETYELRVEER